MRNGPSIKVNRPKTLRASSNMFVTVVLGCELLAAEITRKFLEFLMHRFIVSFAVLLSGMPRKRLMTSWTFCDACQRIEIIVCCYCHLINCNFNSLKVTKATRIQKGSKKEANLGTKGNHILSLFLLFVVSIQNNQFF